MAGEVTETNQFILPESRFTEVIATVLWQRKLVSIFCNGNVYRAYSVGVSLFQLQGSVLKDEASIFLGTTYFYCKIKCDGTHLNYHTEIERRFDNSSLPVVTRDGILIRFLAFTNGSQQAYLYSARVGLRVTLTTQQREGVCAMVFLDEQSSVILASQPVS